MCYHYQPEKQKTKRKQTSKAKHHQIQFKIDIFFTNKQTNK